MKLRDLTIVILAMLCTLSLAADMVAYLQTLK